MPEGHSLLILANKWNARVHRGPVAVSSPQGRFTSEAGLLDQATFTGAEAHGKHLFLHFEAATGHLMVHVHLGLYGKFTWLRPNQPSKSESVRLRVEHSGGAVELIGPTACALVTDEEKATIDARLGPDLLRPEDTWRTQEAWLKKTAWPVGKALMEQSRFAGIGNVYRAEMLFMLALNPWKPCKDISEAGWDEIWDLGRVLLQAGVEDGRIISTRPPLPRPKTLLPGVKTPSRTYVYMKTDRPCFACKTAIEAVPFHGRTLYWCPTCQAAEATA